VVTLTIAKSFPKVAKDLPSNSPPLDPQASGTGDSTGGSASEEAPKTEDSTGGSASEGPNAQDDKSAALSATENAQEAKPPVPPITGGAEGALGYSLENPNLQGAIAEYINGNWKTLKSGPLLNINAYAIVYSNKKTKQTFLFANKVDAGNACENKVLLDKELGKADFTK
jgi:hypothetical protein